MMISNFTTRTYHKVWIVLLCAFSCYGSEEGSNDKNMELWDKKHGHDVHMSYSYHPTSSKPTTTISYIPTLQAPADTLSPSTIKSIPTYQPTMLVTKQPYAPTSVPNIQPSLNSGTPNLVSVPSNGPTSSIPTRTSNQTSPTKIPAPIPAIIASPKPTKLPTRTSTKVPLPTFNPTKRPTRVPTPTRTKTPTKAHSKLPSSMKIPSKTPVRAPTKTPLISLPPSLSKRPTQKPSQVPIGKPINAPNKSPPTKPTTLTPTMKPLRLPTKVPLPTISKLPVPIFTLKPNTKSPTNAPTAVSTTSPTVFPTIFKSFEPSTAYPSIVNSSEPSTAYPTIVNSSAPSTAAFTTFAPSDEDTDAIYECANDGKGIQRVPREASVDTDNTTTRIQLQVAYAAEFSGTDTISLSTLSELEEALLAAAIAAALACGNKTSNNGRRMLWSLRRSLSVPVTDTLGECNQAFSDSSCLIFETELSFLLNKKVNQDYASFLSYIALQDGMTNGTIVNVMNNSIFNLSYLAPLPLEAPSTSSEPLDTLEDDKQGTMVKTNSTKIWTIGACVGISMGGLVALAVWFYHKRRSEGTHRIVRTETNDALNPQTRDHQ